MYLEGHAVVAHALGSVPAHFGVPLSRDHARLRAIVLVD